jgi:hypothetical protein
MIIDNAPGDRIITELYAWVVTDLRTGLEGLFGIAGQYGGEMQAITSSPDTARKIGELIKSLPLHNQKTFRLVRFAKAETVSAL